MQKTAFSTNRPLGTGSMSSCKQETKKSKSSFKNKHQSDNGMRVKANLATGSSAVKLLSSAVKRHESVKRPQAECFRLIIIIMSLMVATSAA